MTLTILRVAAAVATETVLATLATEPPPMATLPLAEATACSPSAVALTPLAWAATPKAPAFVLLALAA